MNRKILTLAAGALLATATPGASAMNAAERVNPFMQPYGTQYDIPPFDKIEISDYQPAFEAGIAQAHVPRSR